MAAEPSMDVAIVGCGGVAGRHLDALRRVSAASVVAVCDRDRGKAERLGRRFGVDPVYEELGELLAGMEPEVVHVLTPPATHAEFAVRAMGAGAHVLVEKPMALAISEADGMIEASERHGVGLGVCHNFLFEPGVLKAKELVTDGALGRIVSVELYWRVSRSRHSGLRWISDLPGGVFHELASHPMYLLHAFLERPRVIAASSQGEGSDGELRVLVESPTGLGSFAISTGTQPHQIWMRLYGTRASLFVDLTTGTVVRLRGEGEGPIRKVARNLDHGLQLLWGIAAGSVRRASGRMPVGHRRLIEAFYAALGTGGPLPVSGKEGRRIVEDLEDIWQAIGR